MRRWIRSPSSVLTAGISRAGAHPAAYRQLAKRWHPDRRRGQDGAHRMRELNAAYALRRATSCEPGGAAGAGRPEARGALPRPAPGRGCPIRCGDGMGWELLAALERRRGAG